MTCNFSAQIFCLKNYSAAVNSFTAESLALALQRSGFERPEVEVVFGGQYLWAKAYAGARNDSRDILPSDGDLGPKDMLGDFAAEWRKRVLSARQRGAVAVWGAGAKGVTFALLVDPDFPDGVAPDGTRRAGPQGLRPAFCSSGRHG